MPPFSYFEGKFMKWFATLLLITITAPSSFSQNLDQLRTRSAEHWKQRVAGNRTGASQYVERESRARFTEAYEPEFVEAKLAAFEFSENLREVLVTVRTVIQLPIGKVGKTMAERWVWSGGNWFLRPAADVKAEPFTGKDGAPAAPSLSFELLDSQLDLGKHTQGDELKGMVRFRGNRSGIANIVTDGFSALRISAVAWNDADGGVIHFVLDSSLISSKFARDVSFVAIDSGGVQAPRKVTIAGEIDGRVEFRQMPEIIDPAKRGRIEIEVKNISQVPLRFTDMRSDHPAFILVEGQRVPTVNPGESFRLQIEHLIQPHPTGAELVLSFADNFMPRPVVVPFNIALPKPHQQPLVDPGLLQQILREQGIR
jgi:hypothetical protein